MPLTNSQNALADNAQQPEYGVLWFPYAINPASSAIWGVGSLLGFTSAGVGSNPGPGGDATSTPYTVALVDLSSTTAANNPLFAGVFLGAGSLGATVPAAPNTISGALPALVAMVGRVGVMQVLCDNTTTIGHTINISTSTAGAGHDSGGTTNTAGTTIGTALQAVTISSGTALVWCRVGG